MGKMVLYGKIGRSMPLTVEGSGTLGGDIEMSAVVTTLAKRHPEDTFVLIGRNSGEDPKTIGMPHNIVNPWHELKSGIRDEMLRLGLTKGPLTVDQQLAYNRLLMDYIGPWFDSADAILMWAGQHGTSNRPIPKTSDRSLLTKPQDAFAHYAGFLLSGINRWRDVDPWNREEIWINADPRNYLKMRDLKWPLRHSVLTQYDFDHNIRHEREGDDTVYSWWHEHATARVQWNAGVEPTDVWDSTVHNVYSRLELNALVPGTPSGDMLHFDATHSGRMHFGIVINEARVVGVKPEWRRLTAMHDWIMPLSPAFIHGTWSSDSMIELRERWGIGTIKPVPWTEYDAKMHSVLSTFTTPSSGSGWATTKPWESFGAGVVCFFHPKYDTQDHILDDAPKVLHDYLRVKTPKELQQRVAEVAADPGWWRELVYMQKAHFDKAMADLTYVKMIEQRIYGDNR